MVIGCVLSPCSATSRGEDSFQSASVNTVAVGRGVNTAAQDDVTTMRLTPVLKNVLTFHIVTDTRVVSLISPVFERTGQHADGTVDGGFDEV